MIRKPLLAIALLLVATPALAAKAAPGDANARVVTISTRGASSHQHMTLNQDKAAIVELDADAKDVLVSNPDIVDAVVRTPRRIFLLASKVGQTNAFFFDGAGRQILSLDIRVEKDVVDLNGMLKAAMPSSNIQVQSLNDNVVLSGTVQNALDSTRAADLAARFAGDPKKVVNMLSVGGGQQVMLKVRIAEMNRAVAKQFGINMSGVNFAGNVPMAASTSNQFDLVGHALQDLSGAQIGQVCNTASAVINPISALNGGGVCNVQNDAQGQLKALEQIGLVHMLAEPNLTAVSGETAKFLAGGEFPVPASRDRDGNVTVVFKQFGVGLSFTPVVLSPGRISLQMSSEVSELSNTGAFLLNSGNAAAGISIPALQVRRAETTVELPSGGSFAVAGLMQHVTKQVLDGFPGLKDMPVLGALFRSRDFQNNETELVVLISAYLVEPTSEKNFVAPTDGFQAPADAETILLGRLNTVYDKNNAKPLAPVAGKPVGYVVQ